ncbi:hypothetical protein Bca52824_003645 [Brassica carinata]|uniref:Ricin B lectin domain-containing protein n=1 Tax=Brassica carinata TaxID=52824 RepID=A0A8X7WNI5_BRACI|nr:hypothetical protein Bca52824_003645 [Brassica carinata]
MSATTLPKNQTTTVTELTRRIIRPWKATETAPASCTCPTIAHIKPTCLLVSTTSLMMRTNRLPDNLAGLAGRQTVKVYSKAEPNYYLTIRDGKVILAPADPSDEAQHWYKDEKYSTRVKDAEGHPCFSLVNKATGEAVKHSVGATQPVNLVRYDPDTLDESVLWTQSKDLGDGYRTIRMVNNVGLNVDAFHGDSKSGGVRDGTTIVLWDWNKGDNQLWKIFPFYR